MKKPKNYRWLEVGEKLKAGDKYWNGMEWHLAKSLGETIKMPHEFIRRKFCSGNRQAKRSRAAVSPSTTGSPSAAPSVHKPSCGMGALEVSKPSSTGKEGAPGVDNSVVRLPVSGSADAELKEALYAVIMALRGINATMAYTALFNRDHVQDDSDRIERAFCIIHKMQSADAPKRSGGKRRKANEKS